MDLTPVADARNVGDMNTAFKRLHNEHVAEHGCSPFGCPDILALNEAYRLWHVRDVARRDGRRVPGEPRERSTRAAAKPMHESMAKPNDDGSITCTGPCGEAKPPKKFPTLKGGIGRGNVCRDCRDAAIAERKAATR